MPCREPTTVIIILMFLTYARARALITLPKQMRSGEIPGGILGGIRISRSVAGQQCCIQVILSLQEVKN